MLNKILTIFQFLVIISLLIFINFYYFSDKNIEKINKNRINLSSQINKILDELPLLKNDTENIIEYQKNDTNLEKIKKRSFWDLLN